MLQGVRLKLIVCLMLLVALVAPTVAGAYNAEITPEEKEAMSQSVQKEIEAIEREKEAKAAAERKAAEERKTGEERAQREQAEARERQSHEEIEREEAQRAEEAQQAREAAARKCVVPSLHGDTLTQARRALHAAHCTLGRITAPRQPRGQLVVVAQSPGHASAHAAGTAVAVTLRALRRGRAMRGRR